MTFIVDVSLPEVLNSADQQTQASLLQGEVLIDTKPHSKWGGEVTAEMYLPIARSDAWQQLTNYSRWVEYFPDLVTSKVIDKDHSSVQPVKRLYQVAKKAFFLLSAQVEIYLTVIEKLEQQIRFQFEKGDFHDFSAELMLRDCGKGTILTYSVRATPTIPVPSAFIQQAMKLDLPNNMQKMRQALCGH